MAQMRVKARDVCLQDEIAGSGPVIGISQDPDTDRYIFQFSNDLLSRPYGGNEMVTINA